MTHPAPNPIAAYASTTDWSGLVERLRAASSIVLLAHRKPDGDAIGSLAAAWRMLEPFVARREVWIVGPSDATLTSLVPDVPLLSADAGPPNDHEPDAILVLDTGAWSQLEPLGDWLRERHGRVLGVDHHARGDDVASARVVDPTSASTTCMLLELVDALGVPLTRELAEPLFLGLATDTGWFRHSNADAKAFRAAARFLDCGVDKDGLYQRVEETHAPTRLAIAGRALASLQFAGGGEVAIQSLGTSDFTDVGAGSEDTVGLVNAPMVVGDVRVAIMATEREPGVTKLSFRGKPGGAGWRDADVNEIAGRYGGGGHRFAAGARMDGDLESSLARLRADLATLPSLRDPSAAG